MAMAAVRVPLGAYIGVRRRAEGLGLRPWADEEEGTHNNGGGVGT